MKVSFSGLALLHEVPRDELAHVKAAEKSRLQDALEIRRVVFEETGAAIVGRDADEDVDRAEAGDRFVDCLFATLAGKSVGLDRKAVDPGGVDCLGGSGELLAPGTVDEGDGGPFSGKFEGAAQSDATGSAGDDSDFFLQFHGGRSVAQSGEGRKG